MPTRSKPTVDLKTINSIYDELVTATELNRQPDRILDKALEHPITITRNDQSFALLRREDVALLVRAYANQPRTQVLGCEAKVS